MFYSSERFLVTAKSLAMLANDQVSQIAEAAASDMGKDYPSEITGAALALAPHFVEKAILTASLPGDVSVRLSAMFVDEFEAVAKIVCNVGGFSNPIKKAFFNASFRTMFRGQYKELRPIVDNVWHMAREEQSDPIDTLALVTVKYCENSSRLKLESENSLFKTADVLHALFRQVHRSISGA